MSPSRLTTTPLPRAPSLSDLPSFAATLVWISTNEGWTA